MQELDQQIPAPRPVSQKFTDFSEGLRVDVSATNLAFGLAGVIGCLTFHPLTFPVVYVVRIRIHHRTEWFDEIPMVAACDPDIQILK
jgi:hypothetical protein